MDANSNSNDEISLKSIILILRFWFKYLSNNLVLILFLSLIGGAFGFFNNYNKEPVYTSICTFVLEGGTGGHSVNGVQGFSPILGISSSGSPSPGSSGGLLSIFNSNNYDALYKSRKILLKALLSEVEFNSKKMPLIDYYIEFNGYRSKKESRSQFEGINFNISEDKFSPRHNKLINLILLDLKNSYKVQIADVGAPVLSIKVSSKDSLFSKVFGVKILEEVNRFYIEIKSAKSKENYRLLEMRVDSLRDELYKEMSLVAVAQENTPNINSALQTIKLLPQRKQIEVSLLQSMYANAVSELELTLNEIRKIQPYILILDKPNFPLQITVSNPYLGLMIGFFSAMILSILLLILRFVIIRAMQ